MEENREALFRAIRKGAPKQEIIYHDHGQFKRFVGGPEEIIEVVTKIFNSPKTMRYGQITNVPGDS